MKITNELSAKELKAKADEQGITYKKNATATQMNELLSWVQDNNTNLEKPTIDNNDVDVNALLNRLNELESLVRETWDTNKIKDFDKNKVILNKFSYSVKLFPMKDYDCPVINWRTISNFVDLSEEKIKANQIIEITYLTKDWKENKKEIQLVQFATFLKRSEKIEAKSIKNLDGTDVYISKQINPETKLEYYIMNSKDITYNVTLKVNWQEITILSTYLNA